MYGHESIPAQVNLGALLTASLTHFSLFKGLNLGQAKFHATIVQNNSYLSNNFLLIQSVAACLFWEVITRGVRGQPRV